MKIFGKRILVEALEKEAPKEGEFSKVNVHDNFVYKGRVVQLGDSAVIDVNVGDVIIYAKYSPDTHDIKEEGKQYKVVHIDDVIAKL